MMRFSTLILLVAGALLATPDSLHAQARDPRGALAALAQLSPNLTRGVLRVTADNGNPNPITWYIQARDRSDGNRQIGIMVTNGVIARQRPRLDLRQALFPGTAITLSQVRVDSNEAFAIAQRFTRANSFRLGTVSYRLEQETPSAPPIWSVWCYNLEGRYIGFLRILATNGSVIETDNLPNSPR